MATTLAVLPGFFAERTRLGRGAGPSNHLLWLGIGLGVLLCLLAVSSRTGRVTHRQPGALLLSLVLLPWVSPGVGLGLVCAVAGALLCRRSSRAASAAGDALGLTAALWLACLCIDAAVAHIEARWEAHGTLAPVLGAALKALGAEAFVGVDRLILEAEHGRVAVLASLDKFGGSAPVCLVGALGVLAISGRIGRRRATLGVAAVAVYAVLRACWVVLADPTPRWWSEGSVLMHMLPLVPFLVAMAPPRRRPPLEAVMEARSHTPGTPLSVACSLGVSALVAALFLTDPGTPKAGRLLIDEHYSDWEWSENPIGTTHFGVQTVYAYDGLVDALGRYYDIERNQEPLDAARLEDVSVLILKTPTQPYPESVCTAVESFVARGGGLWLVGDHTNVFGMSDHLNRVAARFGLRFRSDAVIDPISVRQITRTTASTHPVMQHMPTYIWMTGCSLEAPWLVPDALLSRRLLVDDPDYSNNAGFGDFAASLRERVGAVTQLAAVAYGGGRVLAWTDSTVFSNFALDLPGKLELALGSVEWLRRSNTPLPWELCLWWLGSGAIALAVLRRAGGLVAWAWVGVAVGQVLVAAIGSWAYPLPPLKHPPELVAFLESRGSDHLPLLRPFSEPGRTGYLTAFIAARRSGARPKVVSRLAEEPDADVIVVVHPQHAGLGTVESAAVERRVRAGATLVLLDAAGDDAGPFANLLGAAGLGTTPFHFKPLDLLSDLGIDVDRMGRAPDLKLPNGPRLSTYDGLDLGDRRVAFTIDGGQPLVTLADDPHANVVVEQPWGLGRIVLCGTMDLFSDLSLGENSAIPDRRQYQLLTLLFGWFRPPSEIEVHGASAAR